MVDVAVFYTPAARDGLGGTAATAAEIDMMVAETNAAYGRIGLPLRIRLVARDEVAYTEGVRMNDDLIRLAVPTDGWMDGVHAVRDEVGADLVHLLNDQYDGGSFIVCGIAYLMNDIADFFHILAFGVTDYRCAANLTFAHELGHNMGLRHDRYVLTGGERTNASYPWSFGYVNQRAIDLGRGSSSSIRWKTIMAYGWQCSDAGFYCPTFPVFSSPDWTVGDDPLGVAGDDWSSGLHGPADASRTLEASRRVVANFRQSRSLPCSYSVSPTRRYVLPRGGSPFEFTVTALPSSCPWTPSADADFLHLHTGASTGGGAVSYSVAPHAGLGARTGVIRVRADARVDVAFTVTTGPARLLAPETGGVVSGGVVSIAAAADADLTDLRRWDAAVDRMARSDTLRLQARQDDPGAPGRTHETFVQHHSGVPVHGAGVNREIDRGLAVSIAGVVHEAITVGTDPGLSAAEAARRFEGPPAVVSRPAGRRP